MTQVDAVNLKNEFLQKGQMEWQDSTKSLIVLKNSNNQRPKELEAEILKQNL